MKNEELLKELKSFLDEEGRLKSVPAKAKKQVLFSIYLSHFFELNRVYTEKEVNEIIESKLNGAGDKCTLRRDLVDLGLLIRKSDCTEYRLSETKPDFSYFGIDY